MKIFIIYFNFSNDTKVMKSVNWKRVKMPGKVYKRV